MPRTLAIAAVCHLIVAALAAQYPLLRSIDGTAAGDQCGAAVATVGDVDRDGFPDLATGEPFADANGVDSGRVRVWSGLTGALLFAFTGDPGDHMGTGTGSGLGSGAVAGAGDVDGDGFADIVIGSPGAAGGTGNIKVFSGRTGALLRTHPGSAAGEQFGVTVAGVGDLDGDGFADYAGGAPLADGPPGAGIHRGRARIYSGRTGAVLFAASGANEGDHYGQAICGLGDVDGDGWPDFMITASWSGQVASHCGSAMVYSGRTQAILYTFLGTGLGHEFGTSVAAPGDLNGDGHADIVVSEPEDKLNGDDSGSVHVFDGATGSQLFCWYGLSAYVYFGHQIATGDVDGDGVQDILVGAPFDDEAGMPADAGIVRVFSGHTGVLLGTIRGTQAGELMGLAMAAADLNGDGFCDIVCGAPLRDGNGSDAGSVHVHCGLAAAPRVAVDGTGCPAARPLHLAYGAPAHLGQSLTIGLQNGPAGTAPGYVVFGFNALVQPIDLGPAFPGCRQYAALDLLAPVVLQDGTGSLGITVPAVLAPCGLALWNQGIVFDAAAPGGAAISDRGRVIVSP